MEREYTSVDFANELRSQGYDIAASDPDYLVENYVKFFIRKVDEEAINPRGEKVYFYNAHMPTIIPLSLLLLCGLTFYLYKDD